MAVSTHRLATLSRYDYGHYNATNAICSGEVVAQRVGP